MHPTWHKITDPPTGNKASKTSWATADSFSAGLSITFSECPAGTKAVKCNVSVATTVSKVYYRKSGDTNISNTPHASAEFSHHIARAIEGRQAELWLSDGLAVQLTVVDTGTDIYITYPQAYLL